MYGCPVNCQLDVLEARKPVESREEPENDKGTGTGGAW